MSRSKLQPKLPQSTESGFTIIECLLAIIIVTLLMTAIAPVLALSVATRVQSRRVELATNAARAYIDGLRSGTIPPPPIISTTSSPPVLLAPSPSLNCTQNRNYCPPPPASRPLTTPSATYLYCINFEADPTSNDLAKKGCTNKSSRAMIVQAAAYIPRPTGASVALPDPKKGYQVRLRVYRADAFTPGRTLLKGDANNQPRVAASFTGGTGLGKNQLPLVQMSTEIVTQGTEGTSYLDLCKRLYLQKNPGKNDTQASAACPVNN